MFQQAGTAMKMRKSERAQVTALEARHYVPPKPKPKKRRCSDWRCLGLKPDEVCDCGEDYKSLADYLVLSESDFSL
jgi:hypothetical protein